MNQASTPPFSRPCWSLFGGPSDTCACALEPVALAQAHIDHHSLLFAVFGGQAGHHPGEDTLVAPPFPTVVQRLMRPIASGASRHRKPLRLMKIIPLNTRRSSTRGLPCDLGKKGSRRAICSSLNQKRSDMVTARFRTVNLAHKRKSMGPEPKVFHAYKNPNDLYFLNRPD